MTDLKVTQQAIADALHISRTTVSKAFRNKPVSERVRREILKKAQELGYIDDVSSISHTNVSQGTDYSHTIKVLDAMSTAFYAVDVNWSLIDVNRITEQRWGKKRFELIGLKLWDVFPEYKNIYGTHLLRLAMRERKTAEFETYSPLLKSYVTFYVLPSDTGGLEVYIRDVTGERHMKEMYATTDQLLHLAIDVAGLGFWRWDIMEDRVSPLYLSPKVPAYWHVGSVEESMASVYSGDKDRLYNALVSASRGEQPLRIEYRRMLPGGKIVWIFSRADHIKNKEDGKDYLIGVNYDITDSKELLLRAQAKEYMDKYYE